MKNSAILAIVLVFLVIGVGYYFMAGESSSDSTKGTSTGSSTETKVFTLDASRWEYSQKTINVKVGDHVKININNVDTKHGLAIPELGVSGIDSVEFTADKAGTYEFKCPTFCGENHRAMKGSLVVG